MLRITTANDGTTVRVRLEGKLVGPWVAECRTECARWTDAGAPLEVDVTEVRFVDPEGVVLLRELADAGFVRASSGYTAELLRRPPAKGVER